MTGGGSSPPPELAQARARFLELVAEIRPELHRYCARLTGSVVDGEDVVQDTLAKAFYAVSMATEMPPLRPLLFRIAHNTAMDLLRRYERRHVELVGDWSDDGPAAGSAATAGTSIDRPDPDVVRAALATFLELPVAQRSAVVLKDVLGCTLEEIVESTGASLAAVKAALVRGRAALQARAERQAGAEPPPRKRASGWPERAGDRARLHRYAALFNARDWEALRDLLAQDARLDLVSRTERRGGAVGEYFSRYADLRDFRVVPGLLEDPTGERPALGVHSPRDSEQPSYLVLIQWRGDQVAVIRDFRYVPYIADEIRLGRARFTADQT